jgi:hypothetical protein
MACDIYLKKLGDEEFEPKRKSVPGGRNKYIFCI